MRARFKKGEPVKLKNGRFFGRIATVDHQGGGRYWRVEPSYDIEGSFTDKPGVLVYKHIAESDIEKDETEQYKKQYRRNT